MKKMLTAVAVIAILVMSSNASKAQTTSVNAGTAVDLADTSSANAAVVKDAKAFLARTAGSKTYAANEDITLNLGDSVLVAEFSNVKSRSGKTETQWAVTIFANGKVRAEHIVSAEDPTEALDDKATCLGTKGGCLTAGTAKVSVKHGDGPDGALTDLE